MPTISGTYNLIQYSGANPTLANFVVPTAPAGETYNLAENGGFVQLIIGGAATGVASNWLPTAASSFSWNTASNWSTNSIPHTAGDTANFNSALAGAQTVTVDGLQHVAVLTLNPSTAFAYTVNQGAAGSTIFLDNGAGAAAINNLTQNNVIAAPINLTSTNTNVNVASGTNLTFTGTTSGSGKLTVTGGTGSLTLNGTGAWTGGTEIDSGSIIISALDAGQVTQINNGGVGITTLNGGTLSFTNGAGVTASPSSGFVLNIGPSGGTLSLAPAANGTNGKFNVAATNLGFLTGSGTFTKTGGGDLQIGGPSIGFTGNVVTSGQMEIQSVAALGFGTTTGFTGGSLTVNTGGDVTNGGQQIFNPVTLAGGTLSANGNNNGIFNSPSR